MMFSSVSLPPSTNHDDPSNIFLFCFLFSKGQKDDKYVVLVVDQFGGKGKTKKKLEFILL